MRELIALGGAGCVWDDLGKAEDLFPAADIGAVNNAGVDYPGHLTLWCSLHAEKLERWQRFRQRKGLNTDYTAVSNKRVPGPRIDRLQQQLFSGCSGLYLCQVALLTYHYDRVILCGIPVDERPHYFDQTAWAGVNRYRRGWNEAVQQPELKGKIRSLSGWTKELLGDPREWLAVPAS